MSLVNDMLHDLEKRQAHSSKESIDLEWSVGQDSASVSNRRSKRLLIYVPLVVVLAVWAGWQYKKASDQLIVTSTVFDSQGVDNSESLDKVEHPKAGNNASKPKGLTGVASSNVNGAAAVQLDFDEQTPYDIRRTGNSLSIRLEGVAPQLGDALIEAVAPVATFSVDEIDGATEVVLTVVGEFRHEVLGRLDDKPNLIVNIFPEPRQAKVSPIKQVQLAPPVKVKEPEPVSKKALAKKPKSVASVKKTPVLTPAQKDQKAASQGASLITQGDYLKAEKLLTATLAQQASAPRSAHMYLSLLLSQQRTGQAQSVLDSLSKLDALDLGIMTMQARVYLLNGQAQQSTALLMTSSPSVHKYPGYYELLAQSAQRSRQYSLAEKTYRSLINIDARRGDWWVGLGISLDAQGQSEQAASGYRQALKSGRVTPSLKDYARQRLSAR